VDRSGLLAGEVANGAYSVLQNTFGSTSAAELTPEQRAELQTEQALDVEGPATLAGENNGTLPQQIVSGNLPAAGAVAARAAELQATASPWNQKRCPRRASPDPR
jgi:hypothetical protein